jgi:carbonic anhydrase
LDIIDNGHTIMINYAPGSFIHVGNKQYELKQFHFHRPSEEEINGKRYDMVVHLVHVAQDGSVAVVAVLLQEGENNPLIHELWNDLPREKDKDQRLDNIQINAAILLPADHGYYTFSGSLTTPTQLRIESPLFRCQVYHCLWRRSCAEDHRRPSLR